MKSLIKLLLAILVIGVFVNNFTLVSSVTRSIFGAVDVALARSEMRHIGKYLLRHHQETGQVATRNLAELISRYEPHVPASIVQRWVRDRWDQPYRVRDGAMSFSVLSAGPDRKWGTADDIEERIFKAETPRP